MVDVRPGSLDQAQFLRSLAAVCHALVVEEEGQHDEQHDLEGLDDKPCVARCQYERHQPAVGFFRSEEDGVGVGEPTHDKVEHNVEEPRQRNPAAVDDLTQAALLVLLRRLLLFDAPLEALALVAPAEDSAAEHAGTSADARSDHGQDDDLDADQRPVVVVVVQHGQGHDLGQQHIPEDLRDLGVGDHCGLVVEWVQERDDCVLATQTLPEGLDLRLHVLDRAEHDVLDEVQVAPLLPHLVHVSGLRFHMLDHLIPLPLGAALHVEQHLRRASLLLPLRLRLGGHDQVAEGLLFRELVLGQSTRPGTAPQAWLGAQPWGALALRPCLLRHESTQPLLGTSFCLL
eukprot:scaffold387_cov63-Phaeocystis_antarctica.AAC.4